MRFRVQFDEAGRDIAIKLSREDMAIAADMGERVNIVDPSATLSHTKLLDLDAPNQHGIPVIAGLQSALDHKQSTLNYATTADIDAMFRAVQNRRAKYYG